MGLQIKYFPSKHSFQTNQIIRLGHFCVGDNIKQYVERVTHLINISFMRSNDIHQYRGSLLLGTNLKAFIFIIIILFYHNSPLRNLQKLKTNRYNMNSQVQY